MPLAGFSEAIDFAHYFVATRPPLPFHPIGMLMVLAMPLKEQSKMVGNSACYSPNSWWIDRLQIDIESWQVSCKHLFPFPSYNTSNN